MKKLKTLAAISLAAAGLVGVTVASAQQGPFSPLPSERQAMIGEHFDRADTPGRGSIPGRGVNRLR